MSIFRNLSVPDERDLSTGSNFNPRNTSMYGCLSLLKVQDLRLDLGKNSYFSFRHWLRTNEEFIAPDGFFFWLLILFFGSPRVLWAIIV